MASTTTLSPDDAYAPPTDEPMLDGPGGAEEPVVPQVLLVHVGPTRLALRLADVRAVLRGGRVVRLPGAPTWVPGLSPARGSLVPVADLARLAGRVDGPIADWRVLVEHGERLAYLAVDVVDGVETVDGDEHVVDGLASPTLPRSGAVRLLSQGATAAAGAPAAADVLDVGAVFRELFEED